MNIGPETAELCGIILGDGNLHKKYNRITITGSSDDLLYFLQHVIPLFQSCFPVVHPRIVELKGKKAFNLEIENVDIFNFFTDQYGLQRGPKDNAHIPEIIKTNKGLIPHFLRGLFDTDGCLKFAKQQKEFAHYPRLVFGFVDSPMAYELRKVLEYAGFIAKENVHQNNGFSKKKIIRQTIYGTQALEQWMTEIAPANSVQLAKYNYWKKFKQHEPFMSFTDRLKYIGLPGFEPGSGGPKPPILDR